MSSLSRRLALLRPSPIHAMAQRARDLKAQGREVLDLTLGEPDFDTPAHIIEAAIRAMRDGKTHYTPVHGTPELQTAIREREQTKSGMNWTDQEVTTACGAKQIIFNAMLATLDEGDEVVIPAPYWSAYTDIVTFAGGRPVVVPCGAGTGFRLDPDQLTGALTPKSKWLFLNAPSNPSGAGYTLGELKALAEVLRRHPNVLVLSDEIYDQIVYDDTRGATLLSAAPDMKDCTLVVNGVSKTYAMTGWRLGYACGPKDLIASMGTVQTQNATHTSSISQAAAVAALSGPQDCVSAFRERYRARLNLAISGLKGTPHLALGVPDGAFYLFPSVESAVGAQTPSGTLLSDDVSVAEYLLTEADVATVPGSGFGMPGCLRLSFATNEDVLSRATSAIAAAFGALRVKGRRHAAT